ncbi:MAG: LysM peptidoglycan-binding domain-containing protein [Roseburia sp.]|nr:LysM peptidoglycan-binding domain-containing protein [Roseburia sp.]
MKLKKALCMAALSAAVALTGIPAGGIAEVVRAEETQIAGLDETLKAMYAFYTAGDYASMYALDGSDTTIAYVEMVADSGSDRYIIDLDGNTKAMLYISSNGGWWWYFGQIENNVRQGNGTTVLLNSSNTQLFTGNYVADVPNGTGKLSMVFSDGDTFNISGTFQGDFLNGVYQVDVNWTDSDMGLPHTSSMMATYAANHFQSAAGWNLELYTYADATEYYFWNDYTDVFIDVESGYELFAFGCDTDYYSYWSSSSDYLSAGLSVLQGNSAAATAPVVTTPAPEATTPAPEVTTPAPEATTPAPAVTTPAPTVTPGTYTVERGDNLSKIAQKVYGDQNLWKKIYDANSDTIKSGDYIIWANQVLVIPQL